MSIPTYDERLDTEEAENDGTFIICSRSGHIVTFALVLPGTNVRWNADQWRRASENFGALRGLPANPQNVAAALAILHLITAEDGGA